MTLVRVPFFRLASYQFQLVNLDFMKTPLAAKFVALLACFPGTAPLFADPVDFKEVSLMVRARESEASINNEISRRKLLRTLTPQEEETLKSKGASSSLVQSLRNSKFVVSKEEATAFEARREQMAKAAAEQRSSAAAWAPSDNVHVVEVAFGHPINLSQWGGSDYEFAFYSYRFAGEDHVQPVLIDNVRTFTHVSRHIPIISEDEVFSRDFFPTNAVRNWRFTPQDGRADLKDRRINLGDAVSTSSHSASRAMQIDWNNPVHIKGVPYTLYRVYGAGGATLYFISASSHSVKLAVSTL